MQYLKDLVKMNGDNIVQHVKSGHKYMSVFDYSVLYGGTFDSFKYYNDYLIDVEGTLNNMPIEKKNKLKIKVVK